MLNEIRPSGAFNNIQIPMDLKYYFANKPWNRFSSHLLTSDSIFYLGNIG